MSYEIVSRDLLNILRHAYLSGFNEGVSRESRASRLLTSDKWLSNHLRMVKEYNKIMEAEFEHRDSDLLELITDWKAQSYMSYNDDIGSLEEG